LKTCGIKLNRAIEFLFQHESIDAQLLQGGKTNLYLTANDCPQKQLASGFFALPYSTWNSSDDRRRINQRNLDLRIRE
jgi:hypothetical protein